MDCVLVSTRQHEGTLLPYLTLYRPEVSVLLRMKFKPLRAGVPEPLQSLCWELSSHWDHHFQLDTSRNLLVAGTVFISSVGTWLPMHTLKETLPEEASDLSHLCTWLPQRLRALDKLLSTQLQVTSLKVLIFQMHYTERCRAWALNSTRAHKD